MNLFVDVFDRYYNVTSSLVGKSDSFSILVQFYFSDSIWHIFIDGVHPIQYKEQRGALVKEGRCIEQELTYWK